jgi:putative membrane protein
MQRASNLFNEQQRKQIEQAIVEAEAKTSCEIVPVVATASGRYDRAEDVIGLWLAVIAAVVVWLLFPRIADDTGSWSGTSVLVGVLTMIAAVAVVFVAGAIIGSQVGWLRRLFIPRQQLLDEVAARTREVFFDKRVITPPVPLACSYTSLSTSTRPSSSAIRKCWTNSGRRSLMDFVSN